MSKPLRDKTVPVQGRLTPEEVKKLDRLAAEQSIPVGRSALITFILRKWLDCNGSRKARAGN